MRYKQSIASIGIKSPPWLLSGINSSKILTLNEDEFSFNLFSYLLLRLPLPNWVKSDNKYKCSCNRIIEGNLFPNHWASCKDAYNYEKFKRHNYCVDRFTQFMKAVIVKDPEKSFFVGTESAINVALKGVDIQGEMVDRYRINKAKKIIPDVMITMDSVSAPRLLEIDY